MNVRYSFPSGIPQILADYLHDESVLFVFPTDIAASSWADWSVSHPDASGVSSVPLERFTAWDTFKSSMMNAKVQGRKSIPSLLRKIFVRRLIAENAQKAASGTPLFVSIINPSYAQNAYSFTDWISRILPSLESWHEKYERWLSKQAAADDDAENRDYLALYVSYKAYLDDNGLFEPSWITPDFSIQGKTCVIFYPETLEDFSDYRERLTDADGVQLVMLPEPSVHPSVSFYSNSRTELRAAALKIRRLAAEDGVTWTDIAVSVSDPDMWRPYIEREFALYCIPFVMRAGESYTACSAGRVFREMQDCEQNSFSYDSVRALLLDGYVPWKDKKLNENLVREGCERKCVCSYEENGQLVDPWEQALAASNTGNTTERELRTYHNLKKRITALCRAGTFRDVRTQWFTFRSDFLSEADFSQEADLILGRCLKVLSDLIDIEDEFITPFGLTVPSPYGFFLNELENSIYQKQQDHTGVSVFPYRLSSCAHFKYQFILDSSQKRLTVPYRNLSFLSKRKRQELLGPDRDDVSTAFVRLYAESGGTAFFSASEQTFGGFSIPYSFLAKKDDRDCDAELGTLADGDFIVNERNSIAGNSVFPQELTQLQKDSFTVWMRRISVPNKLYADPDSTLKGKITELLCTNRSRADGRPGVLHVSQTDLKHFYPCRRAWIFSQVLRLRDDTLDTSLMEQYDAGSIHHKMLELFMESYKDAGKVLPAVTEDGTLENEADIRNVLTECAGEAFRAPDGQFTGCPLVLTVLDSQKERFADTIVSFLRTFCKMFGGYAVTAVEQWMSGSYSDGNEVALTGRIDCILSDENGGVTIVDYKNTSAAAPSSAECIADENGMLGDFQIPLYVTLWNMNHPDGPSAVENALFCTINDRKNRFIIKNDNSGRSGALTLDEYAYTLSCFNEYIRDFTDSVRSYRLGIDSDHVDAYRDCVKCRFKSICRTAYISSGVHIPKPQGALS